MNEEMLNRLCIEYLENLESFLEICGCDNKGDCCSCNPCKFKVYVKDNFIIKGR